VQHGSLFSGIGGFDLAASWMGWTNVFHCEKDAFCRKVLRHYWPQAVCYEEIGEFDANDYRGRIDVLTGGFPCQPFSRAGKRKGTADNRHLWPQMCRIIGEVRPRWIVGENVLGLLDWNRGMVFDQVQADLETQGYQVCAFVLPAAGVGAPHKRDRVWIVAYADPDAGAQAQRGSDGAKDKGSPGGGSERLRAGLSVGTTATGGGRENTGDGLFSGGSLFPGGGIVPGWESWPLQSLFPVGDDGVPAGLDAGAVSRWRSLCIQAIGNAVVPQVVLQIFRVIETFDKRDKTA
jgi:DNA (cytosine-5)-methyltransferase 1